MLYADYQDYQNNYKRGLAACIPEADFPFYAQQASHRMDYLTWGRITDTLAETENIKNCCCEMAEAIYRYERARNNDSGAPVSSWSNDGESGSYDMSGSDVTQNGHEKQIGQIARKYLLRLGLLNRGC